MAANYVLDFAEFETNLWMILFYTIPASIALWQGMQGWRQGLTRKVVALLSLAAAFATAWFGGEYVLGMLPANEPSHPFARDLAGSAIAGIGTYVVLRLLAVALLFRGKSDIGLLDRLGGLVVGLGIAGLWVLAWGLSVRYVSTVLETSIYADMPEDGSPKETMEKHAPEQNPIVRAFLYWNQRSRETGTDERIEQADPIAPSFYKNSRNLVLLSRSPTAMARLAADPKVSEFLDDDPSLLQLAADKEIVTLIEKRSWLDLLRHPKVYSTLRDEAFLQRLRESGLDRAMAQAVEENTG
ncbi:MAG: CvpA family protein [Verrucomicrobia bacterium]|nr:CvpA family protein [Verrucomicrobiota bacterium]